MASGLLIGSDAPKSGVVSGSDKPKGLPRAPAGLRSGAAGSYSLTNKGPAGSTIQQPAVNPILGRYAKYYPPTPAGPPLPGSSPAPAPAGTPGTPPTTTTTTQQPSPYDSTYYIDLAKATADANGKINAYQADIANGQTNLNTTLGQLAQQKVLNERNAQNAENARGGFAQGALGSTIGQIDKNVLNAQSANTLRYQQDTQNWNTAIKGAQDGLSVETLALQLASADRMKAAGTDQPLTTTTTIPGTPGTPAPAAPGAPVKGVVRSTGPVKPAVDAVALAKKLSGGKASAPGNPVSRYSKYYPSSGAAGDLGR